MMEDFVSISHGIDVVLPNSNKSISQVKGVVPRSLFPLLIPIDTYLQRECKFSGYAGVKYHIISINMDTDDILVLETAEDAVEFTDKYLVGRSRIDWPRMAKKYKGILIDLDSEEIKKLPQDDDRYEWALSLRNILSIWNMQGLEVTVNKVKNHKALCSR